MWENNYIEHNCCVIDTINSYDNLIANDPEPPKKGWKSWSNGKRFLWILLNLFTSFIPLVLYLVFPLIKPFLMPKSEPLLSADEKRKWKCQEMCSRETPKI